MDKAEDDCVALLQAIRWNGKPSCPYCSSTKCCSMRDHRFHCNSCNTAFSVTTQTIFHQTRIPLTKWFEAISFVLESSRFVSSRNLAIAIGVNKNTGYRLLQQIEKGLLDPAERAVIRKIKLQNEGGHCDAKD